MTDANLDTSPDPAPQNTPDPAPGTAPDAVDTRPARGNPIAAVLVFLLALVVVSAGGFYMGHSFNTELESQSVVRPRIEGPNVMRSFSGAIYNDNLDTAEGLILQEGNHRPLLELVAGTAAVNRAMYEKFEERWNGCPLPPLSSYVDDDNSDFDDKMIAFNDSNITVRGNDDDVFKVDLSTILEDAPEDLGRAQAMRASLDEVAKQIADGEFDTLEEAQAAASAAIVGGALRSMDSGE